MVKILFFKILYNIIVIKYLFLLPTILDFDGDGFVGHMDLQQSVTHLTNHELTLEEVQLVADKILEEADVDDDGKLSFMEFEHVVTRSPDFMRYTITFCSLKYIFILQT